MRADRMELVPKKRLQLYAGRSHMALAEDIAGHLGVDLGEANLREFATPQVAKPRRFECWFGCLTVRPSSLR